ncbi:unnamed protein product [Allacma fusca]|uniref:ER-bound oxygenase mpaB/mpaB'/Rubber oxygenase catalytic domain-containing protein n=1 Tax=Allacma fusca TaxID=39272 RepID=A0A8J2KXS4_9HEXA|nr:unnamed protein product [Allacma fusca]
MHYFKKYREIFLFLACLRYAVVSESQFNKICKRSRRNQECSKITIERNVCNNVRHDDVPHCAVPVDELFQGAHLRGLVDLPSFAPSWLNKTLYREGQKWARENYSLVTFCHYVGALLVAFGADAGKVILGTGKSHVLEKAIPRYAATMRQIWLWYDNELTNENDIVFTSLKNVRAIHQSVDVQYENSTLEQGATWIQENLNWDLDEAMWDAVLKDLNNSDIPEQYRSYSENILENLKTSQITLNQFRMAVTQHLFVAIPFIVRNSIDVTNPTEEQMLGWNHLWAVLGYALGIEDEYNVALHPSLKEIHAYYTEFFNKIILPGLFSIQSDSKILVEVLLQILHKNTPTYDAVNPRLFMTFILADVVGVKTSNMESLLTTVDKIIFHAQKPVQGLLKHGPQFLTDLVNKFTKAQAEAVMETWFKYVVKSDYLIAKYMYY